MINVQSRSSTEKLLEEWLSYLNLSNVSYCLLGDTRPYPTYIDSDIDVVVDKDFFKSIPLLMKRFCDNSGYQLAQIMQHEQTAKYFVVALTNKAGHKAFLHPDICTDYFKDGRRLLSSSELTSGRRIAKDTDGNPKGFWIPEPKMAFLYYLLKKIHKGSLNKRQGEYLSMVFCEDPAGAAAQIKRFWIGADAELITSAASSGSWSAVCKSIPKLRQSLHAALPFSLVTWLREQFRKAKRFMQPTGTFVAFLGADGAGKSTVLAEVERSLAPAFRRTKRYHLRPHLGASTQSSSPVTEPHDLPPRGYAVSLTKLAYWWVDYLVGYLADIYQRLARSTFVTFDRYYYDLLVDPQRYRYGAPAWAARIVSKFVPRPDIVILLDAPAEVLQARKQEVTLDETVRQRRAYLKLVRSLPNGHVVDASHPLEDAVADVETIIIDYLVKRTAKRSGMAPQ